MCAVHCPCSRPSCLFTHQGVCKLFLGPPDFPPTAQDVPSDVTLGSIESFWAMDKSQDVDSFFKLDAAAKYVGEHCVIYVDTSKSVPQVSLDSLGSRV